MSHNQPQDQHDPYARPPSPYDQQPIGYGEQPMPTLPQPPMVIHPPMMTGTFPRPATRPVWPKVIGILMIVFAAIGLTCLSIFGVIAATGMDLAPAENEFQRNLNEAVRPVHLMSVVISLGVAVMQLLAGIQLSSYKRAGIAATRQWAVAAIAVSVIFTAWTLAIVLGLDANTSSEQAGKIGGVVGGIFGLLTGNAMPIFCLIFLAYVKPYEPSDG